MIPKAEEANPPMVPIAEMVLAAAAPIAMHIVLQSHNKVGRGVRVEACGGL